MLDLLGVSEDMPVVLLLQSLYCYFIAESYQTNCVTSDHIIADI